MLQLAVIKAHDARRVVHRARGAHLVDGDATFWPRMKDSFAAIPLHDVPDPLLVDVIVLATDACSKMDSLYERLSSPNYVVYALDGTSVDGAVLTLDECVSRAFNIRFSEQPVRRFLFRAMFAVAAPIWKRVGPYVTRRTHQPPKL